MIAIFVIIILTIAIIEYRSLNRNVGELRYKISPSNLRVEQNEEFMLTSTFENRTGRRMPYIHVEEYIPNTIILVDKDRLHLDSVQGATIHISTLFIRKNERVRHSVKVKSLTRGQYHFDKNALHVGDFLGIKARDFNMESGESVIVYPRKIYDARLDRIVSEIMGDIVKRSFLFEDTSMVLGYRDYTGREPFKSISFNQSAKRGALTVKEYDHTLKETVNVIFDPEYKCDFDNYNDQLEAAFSVVRAILTQFERQGVSYRFITNLGLSRLGYTGVTVFENRENGKNSFGKILDFLSISTGARSASMEELLSYVAKNYKDEKEFIYVSHTMNSETEKALLEMKSKYGIGFRNIAGADYVDTYKMSVGGEVC